MNTKKPRGNSSKNPSGNPSKNPPGNAPKKSSGRTEKIGADWAYGTHAVQAILQVRPEAVLECYIQPDGASAHLAELAEQVGVKVQGASRPSLDERAGGHAHQGVLLRYRPSADLGEKQLYELATATDRPLLLALDGVTDAHNLGACIRAAEALGVNALILPRSNSAAMTPAARKTASGAAEYLPVARVGNLARVLRHLRERLHIQVVGLDERAEASLFEVDLNTPCALVLGAEGSGMRRLTRENCDTLASIPMRGNTPSLNVAMAATASLYEVRRQRN